MLVSLSLTRSLASLMVCTLARIDEEAVLELLLGLLSERRLLALESFCLSIALFTQAGSGPFPPDASCTTVSREIRVRLHLRRKIGSEF